MLNNLWGHWIPSWILSIHQWNEQWRLIFPLDRLLHNCTMIISNNDHGIPSPLMPRFETLGNRIELVPSSLALLLSSFLWIAEASLCSWLQIFRELRRELFSLNHSDGFSLRNILFYSLFVYVSLDTPSRVLVFHFSLPPWPTPFARELQSMKTPENAHSPAIEEHRSTFFGSEVWTSAATLVLRCLIGIVNQIEEFWFLFLVGNMIKCRDGWCRFHQRTALKSNHKHALLSKGSLLLIELGMNIHYCSIPLLHCLTVWKYE